MWNLAPPKNDSTRPSSHQLATLAPQRGWGLGKASFTHSEMLTASGLCRWPQCWDLMRAAAMSHTEDSISQHPSHPLGFTLLVLSSVMSEQARIRNSSATLDSTCPRLASRSFLVIMLLAAWDSYLHIHILPEQGTQPRVSNRTPTALSCIYPQLPQFIADSSEGLVSYEPWCLTDVISKGRGPVGSGTLICEICITPGH